MKKISILKAIFVASVILTGCDSSNTNNAQTEGQKAAKSDTTAYLCGKWKYEEMGIAMNLEINSDKTFSWSSDFGNFNGSWSRTNNLVFFTPSDNLNPPFTLAISKDGSLEEQTNENVKPVYIKI